MLESLFDTARLKAFEPDGNHLVLTANHRLANKLLDALHEKQRQQKKAWRPLQVMPIDQWLQTLILKHRQKSRNVCPVLSPIAERVMWRQIMENDTTHEGLALGPLSQRCLQARQLLMRWMAQTAQHEFLSTEQPDRDANTFRTWYGLFSQHCSRIGRHPIEHWLWQWFDSKQGENHWPVIHTLELDDTAVLYQALIEQAAMEVRPAGRATPVANAFRCPSATSDESLEAASIWLKRKLENPANRHKRFALVIPDIQIQRDRVERLLKTQLTPSLLEETGKDSLAPVNISAGHRLNTLFLTRPLLQLLDLVIHGWNYEALQDFLLSPHWGNSLTQNRVREMHAVLQHAKTLPETLSIKDIAALAGLMPEPEAKKFFAAINFLGDSMDRQASPADWMDTLRSLLQTIDWPGPRKLSSREHQACKALLEAFRSFTAIEQALPVLTFHDCVRYLKNWLQEQTCQYQTEDSPVQVLGPLEAQGLSFEAIFVCGCNLGHFPPRPEMNPLLGVTVQRQYKMPGADPVREKAFVDRLFSSLLSSAKDVVFGHAALIDGLDAQPHPVVQNLHPISIAVLRQHHAGTATVLKLPFSKVPVASGHISGGTGIFEALSACPFKAYAQYGLKLPNPEPDVVGIGLTASERGQLIHKLLETYWNDCDTGCIDLVSLKMIAKKQMRQLFKSHRHLPRMIVEAEVVGAKQLVLRWLSEQDSVIGLGQIDKTLSEKKMRFHLRASHSRYIEFDGRIDRAERLPDGRLLLVDYKTGRQYSSQHWKGPRPKAPQLPLYAMAMPPPYKVAAVAFACLHPDQMQRIGTDVDTEHWQESLTALADQLLDGDTHPDPAEERLCGHCAWQGLCRNGGGQT
jgi:probable DNA repair protein